MNATQVLVRAQLQHCWQEAGSDLELERRISRQTGCKIDRRRLTKARLGQDAVDWSFEELGALDAYLSSMGGGFLRRPRLLALLAQQPRLTFVVPAYARKAEQRTDVSIWDFRTATRVIGAIEQMQGSAHFDIETVVDGCQSPQSRWDAISAASQAVCVIGSPRAFGIAELLLERVFGSRGGSPFAFLWPRVRFREMPRGRCSAAAKQTDEPGVWGGLEVGGKTYWERRDTDDRRTYGVIALHVGSGDDGMPAVAALIAGLTGPGSLAAAEILATQADFVSTGADSGVYWAAVEARVKEDASIGDNRVLVPHSARLIAGPEHLPVQVTDSGVPDHTRPDVPARQRLGTR